MRGHGFFSLRVCDACGGSVREFHERFPSSDEDQASPRSDRAENIGAQVSGAFEHVERCSSPLAIQQYCTEGPAWAERSGFPYQGLQTSHVSHNLGSDPAVPSRAKEVP